MISSVSTTPSYAKTLKENFPNSHFKIASELFIVDI